MVELVDASRVVMSGEVITSDHQCCQDIYSQQFQFKLLRFEWTSKDSCLKASCCCKLCYNILKGPH